MELNKFEGKFKTNRHMKWLPYLMVMFRSLLFLLLIGLFSLFVSGNMGERIETVAPWWPLIVIIGNFISLPILIKVSRSEGIPYRDLLKGTYKKTNKYNGMLMISFVLVALIGMYLIAFLVYGFNFLEPADVNADGIEGYFPSWAMDMMLPLPLWASILSVLILPITVGLVEIPLYIGYCLPRLERVTKSGLTAILITAFFFSFQHAFLPLTSSFTLFIFRAFSYLPTTLFLTVWYRKSRYKITLIPVMIAHVIVDFIAMMQLFVINLLR